MTKDKKRLLEKNRKNFSLLKQKYIDMFFVYKKSLKPNFIRH